MSIENLRIRTRPAIGFGLVALLALALAAVGARRLQDVADGAQRIAAVTWARQTPPPPWRPQRGPTPRA